MATVNELAGPMIEPRGYVFPILVCGGREYCDGARLYAVLDAYLALYGDLMIIHGAARGADLLAEAWAKSREQIYVGFPARWGVDPKRAGIKRNAEMASLSGAELVVAFRGGPGTRNMVAVAQANEIPVHEWDFDT